ncbi:MAG: dipeptidyl aminopeptidases/acylaminoacyl-peptidase [Elusimicrobia bacterium]|nr:MAG: dipeptidyl aminopeptidases/acylaminoacyl-peptidase [Elusimicrobiota bacterium]
MTATAALVVAVLLAAGLYACWWGTNMVFHPHRMLPNAVFPEQFSLGYEEVSFSTGDAAKATDKTIFFCHGWGDNKGDLLRRFHFLAADFNLFLFDSRHHGESEGELSTIGSLEARDFAAALAWLKANHPSWTRRLSLLGLSMGAAMAVRGMAVHGGFQCALLESPFRSFNRVVHQFGINAYHMPYFPLVWLMLVVLRWRLGHDPEPFSPVRYAADMPAVPLFFIAGEKDALMPLSEVVALHAMCKPPKELWVVPNGEHGRCQEAAGPEYDRRVRDFFLANSG